MDIESTNIAPIDPKRGTVNFTNGAASRRRLVEVQRMVGVDDVAELVRQLGAKWVHVEVTVLAPVEQPLHVATADVADPVVLARALGLTDYKGEWVEVEE